MKKHGLIPLTEVEVSRLLTTTVRTDQGAFFLLMIDCGLSDYECGNLRYGDLDLVRKTVRIIVQRKETEKGDRTIFITERLFRLLEKLCFQKNQESSMTKSDFLFSSSAHWRPRNAGVLKLWIKKARESAKIQELTAGCMTATFDQLNSTEYLPGEAAGNMSALNYDVPPSSVRRHEIQNNIPLVVNNKKNKSNSFSQTLSDFTPSSLSAETLTQLTDVKFPGSYKTTIGRETEIAKLRDFAKRNINCIILGPVGVGKSRLLALFEEEAETTIKTKIIKLDDANMFKASLTQMLLFILKTDQQGLYKRLYPQFDDTQVVQHLSRNSPFHFAKHIIEVTEKKAYTLLIDNVDRITPSSAKILEIFKDHFTIITSARAIPMNRASFTWNFEIIRLIPLRRQAALRLITLQSQGIDVVDIELFRNHIYQQTDGNPRAIGEMIERYRSEPFISNKIVRGITHRGALPEYDCTFLVLIFLACVACLRYFNHEVNNESFKVLGGMALVFLFITRYFFRGTKRKNL